METFSRHFILGIMVIAVFTLAGLSSASPDTQTNDTVPFVPGTNASSWDFISPPPGLNISQEFVDNEIFVQFSPLEGLPNAEKKAAREKVHKKVGGSLKKTFNIKGFEDLHLVRIPEGFPLDSILLAYRNDPLVEYAGPNYIISVLDSQPENLTSGDAETLSIPDDPFFADQWALLNIGQMVNGYPGTPGADINIGDAWNITKGSCAVTIAVIDTGVDTSHFDLSGNIWVNSQEIPGNSLDDDGNGYVDDYQGYDFIGKDGDPDDAYGHGTLCAGIIGASGNNGLGISGVNWNTRIMPLKCLDSQGFGSTADAIEAIDYAEQMGAEIISLSWGCSEYDPVLHEVISRSPALIVCAAGNSARDIDITPVYPAGYDCDNIISVAASDQDDNLAPFSNWGETSVDLVAPGVNILTTCPSSIGNSYVIASGTSMAAPYVAGVAGMIQAGYPDATPFEMKTRILSSAEKNTALEGKTVTEGRLDAGKSLDPAIPIPSPSPTQPTVTPTPTPDPQAGPLSISPVNPDFVEYMLHPYTNGTAEHGLGFIPPPFDSSYLKGMAVDFSGSHTFSYPSYYDLRTTGNVTPVKDQGSCGSCWAFATYGSLESVLLPDETWDFSENNLNNLHGFDILPCKGGNYDMATAYTTRWSGPVRESDDPYPSSPPSPSPAGLLPVKHVQDVFFIPARSSATDNDNIKQAITIFGGVYTSFFYDDPSYNASDYNYYYSGTSSTNHAVTIVGWDDNRMISGTPGPGAFIVKNSWGTSWGEGGYFYISYYDSKVGNYSAVFTAENLTNYENVAQFDPLGCTSSIGYGTNTSWAANIFTAESYQLLKATGFYALVPNTGYQIYIYKNPTVGPLNSSGYIASKNGTISAPGFHTVVLDTVVPLNPGDDYSIVIKITTPGYIYPIPVEMPVRGYSSEADAHSGQSYISNSGTSWTDLTSIVPDFREANVCIKGYLYTSGMPDAAFGANQTSGFAPITVQFNDTSTNRPASWQWNFGDGSPNATVQNPVHTYQTEGNYTVTLTVSNAFGSDSESKPEYIEVLPCPEPVTNFSANQTSGTIPLIVQFTDSSTNSPTSWSWEFGDGSPNATVQNPVHTYTSVGTFTVNLTATNDCGSNILSKADFIEVSPCPEPIATFSANQTSGIVPLIVQFTDSSTNTPNSWSWEFGDGATSEEQNPVHTYTSVGTFTVNLTATNDCGTDMLSRADFIEVSPCPEPVANFSANQTSGIVPLTVQFTDSSTNTPTAWSWEFGDGATSEEQNPVHTYTSVGTFTVNLTATNDCGSNTFSQPGFIDILPCPEPVANFSANDTSGTVPLIVQFTDSSTNTPTSWFWEFGDGETSEEQNPVHTYTSVGSFTVNLTATNGCGTDTLSQPDFIEVSPCPEPVANFSVDQTSGTIPFTVQFTDSSTNTPNSWSWEFGDGANSEDQNPVHTYTSVGIFTVNLTATNDCGSDSISRIAIIRVSPQQMNSISLSKGWNFISIPSFLTDSSTTGVLFNGVDTNGYPIWHYNASSHQWTQLFDNTIPHPMEGIWLYSEEFSEDTPISLDFQTGPIAPPVIHLSPGWNAIGIGSRSSQSSSTVLAQLGSRWSTLLIYDNDLQMYHQPAVNGYAEVIMEPGRGYWIYMKEPADFAAVGM